MRAFAEIDLQAISSNIGLISRKTSSEILAVVKADAYGHGLIPVAQCALNSGASWLGVALLEEALTLRAADIASPIIAWLTPPGDDFESAIRLHIDLSVSSISLLEEILGVAKNIGVKPRIHIEVDTGMHRGGLLSEWESFVEYLALHKEECDVIGFWSHFARADEPGESYNIIQYEAFNKKLESLIAAGITPKIIHFANSAASLSYPTAHLSMIRLGIAMYGLSPDASEMGSSMELGLRPAMSLKAKLHLVKKVKAGSPIGYGGSAITPRDTILGVVTFGYADGLPRIATSAAGVTFDNQKAPLIGRVSMDQCVVDLGPDSKAKAGDFVEIFGAAGYTADDWGAASSSINYEIVTRIASRIPRIYL